MILVPIGAEHRAVVRGGAGSIAATSILAVPAGRAAVGALDAASGESFLILGLCGALADLRVGDAVVCDSVSAGGVWLPFDSALTERIAEAAGARRGRALTADRIVTTRAERERLRRESGADVVEMEGFHLAQRLLAQRCTVAMLRVVSDDARYDLPDLDAAIDANGRLRPLAVARAFAASPVAAVRFIRDVRRALAVLESTTARAISR